MSEESSQAAELNADHGDIDPGFGAGFGSFVVAHQAPLAHQAAEGSFHHPAARQDFEASGVIGAFDDLDGQLGPQFLDSAGERFPSVAAIHPQDAQPGEPAQDPAQHQLCAPSRSVVLAGVTATPSSSPKVSTSRCRLRPLIRLPASYPTGPP